METKKCIDCDQEIAATETKCPKCGLVFEDAEQEMSVVEKAQQRLEKKRKRETPEPPAPAPTPAGKKSVFASLGKVVE